jgi:hypothetical protein
MAKYAQGLFEVTNPDKYMGNHKPRYRSSWELRMMSFFDNNKSVLKWVSEGIRIPYKHPLSGKITTYVPDFFVVYVNKYGKQLAELIEVKPKSQTSLLEAKSTHDKLHAIVNAAKWQAANAYCKANGIVFRIITESDIFHTGSKK